MIRGTYLHYKILDKLGEGGMGVVYLAEDTKLNRQVALKFLPGYISANSEERERFKTEARAAAALNHPNIAQIYAIEECDDQLFIVMEYVRGKELKDIIRTQNLSLDQKKQIALQACKAFSAAHKKGIIHRDIKSGNIMLDENGNVKVMDFGLAKILGSAQVTREGSTLGTTAYMSPEQITGQSVDQRSDIWSFGVLMYELYTGKLPFDGVYEQALMYSILEEKPADISTLKPDIPGFVAQVIEKCLNKDKQFRYPAFEDIIADLTGSANEPESNQKIHKQSKQKDLNITRSKTTYLYIILSALILVVIWIYIPSYSTVQSWLGIEKKVSAKHILILPLKNIGNDSKYQTLCDGLVETLSSKITEIEKYQGNLWVVPISEVQQYHIASPGEANKEFGVNLVVSGSLQLIQGGARLTLNLVDAKKMVQLNSAIIDVSLKNIASLQRRSVSQLLNMLNIELNPQLTEDIHKGETTVPGAYEYYLQGVAYLRQYEKESNIDNSIELFKEAIKIDSSYALAYAALGEAYWRKYDEGKDPKYVPIAKSFCQKALGINNNLAPVNVTMGLINLGTGEYDHAVTYFSKALDIDPKDAKAFRGLAKTYEAQKLFRKAEATYRKAISLKPDYWAGYNDFGVYYYRHSEYKKAIEQFKQVVQLTPDNYRGYSNLGGMYYYLQQWTQSRKMFEHSLALKKTYFAASNLATLDFIQGEYIQASKMYEIALKLNKNSYELWGGLAASYYWSVSNRDKAKPTYEKAIKVAEEHLKVNPKDPGTLSSLAGFYADIGNKDKSQAYLRRSLKLASDDPNIMFSVGSTYEKLGNRDKALIWIGKSIDNGYSESDIIYQPELKSLVNDRRFQKLISKNN
jgi:serine/threonine protein kinase/Tfp pilus assembly protein PilF